MPSVSAFVGTVLSRLAYAPDRTFASLYSAIVGPILDPPLLSKFDQNDASDGLAFDCTALANQINVVLGEVRGTNPSSSPPSTTLTYVSIADSNYGEVYVCVDTLMPKTALVLFRGTSSSKSAACYTTPTSIVPFTINAAGDRVLKGIYKITAEIKHVIAEALRHVATPGAKLRVCTCGHSLGGAMATLLAYEWSALRTAHQLEDLFDETIRCISVGAPRVLDHGTAAKFSANPQILYRRVVTRGDPVPNLPSKTVSGFEHPHDTSALRADGLETCNALLTMRPMPGINPRGQLDCQARFPRAYGINPLSHTVYLNVLFLTAVDVSMFMKGMVSFTTKEIARDPATKNTMVRLVFFAPSSGYKHVFYNLHVARGIAQSGGGLFDWFSAKPTATATATPTATPTPAATAATTATAPRWTENIEDVKMTSTAFKALFDAAQPATADTIPMQASDATATNGAFQSGGGRRRRTRRCNRRRPSTRRGKGRGNKRNRRTPRRTYARRRRF